jgi:RIP metalloprotease RseP
VTDTIDRPPDIEAEATAPPTAPSPSGGWARLATVGFLVGALGYLAGWGVVAMILAIVVSIFLHELGHYVVAKRAGMKVTEFFIGFGPRIWSFRRGETEYGLKAVPAGAYVRIIGMSNLEDVAPEDEARTYRAQSYPKRLATVLGGPFANFGIALVLLFVVFAGFGIGRTADWAVEGVVDGSAAAAAGIEVGDRIVAVNDQPIDDFDDLGPAMGQTAGRPTDVTVERGGQEVVLSTVAGWRLNAGGAAAVPPLRDGDRILTVDGETVTTYDDFVEVLGSSTGQARIEFERGAGGYRTTVPVPVVLPDEGAAGFLGIIRGQAPRERLGVVDAGGRTVTEFGNIVVQSVQGVGKVFSPSGLSRYAELVTTSHDSTARQSSEPAIEPLDPNGQAIMSAEEQALQESRPISIIGIVRLGSQAADSGAVLFLMTLILVNIFLGLFNLLPLPPLDGGHAAVATYESIRGRIQHRTYRVDMAKLMPVTYTVLFLLVGLGVSSIYLDIINPVPNPFGP